MFYLGVLLTLIAFTLRTIKQYLNPDLKRMQFSEKLVNHGPALRMKPLPIG
jgi:hypothetical protein